MAGHVLVVDDSPIVRQMVSNALTKAGFQTLQAADGIDALETAMRTPDLSVIVCDVNMPRMNGVELVEELQRKGNKVPVVMLTTEGQPDLIKRAKAAGAKGWLVKPFKADLLLLAIKKLCEASAEAGAA